MVREEFMLKGIVSAVIGLLIACTQLTAQSLSASISRNPVTTGEQFQVTFTLNASGSAFEGPSFSEFSVLSGPNQSSSVQIINGNITQSLSFTYYLQAKTEGQFKIGSASIVCNGKKLESPPFTISVVKGQLQSQQGNQQPQQPGSEGVSAEDVFIRAIVDKTNVYRGEGVSVTFRLYTRVQLVNYALTKTASLNGFYSVDIPMPGQLDISKVETVNGVQYNYGDIRKSIAFPQQSGTLTIDAMEGECIARVRTQRKRNPNDPFDVFNDPFFNDPFFNRGFRDVKIALASHPVKITVKNLPPGAPASFKGMVGKFSFEATLDRNEANANDAISLRIKLNGKGNIRLFNAPAIEVPPRIESYEPKLTDNTTVNSGGVSGSRMYDYLLIPRNEGNYEIPAVTFSYFDLDKKSYESFTSGPFRLKVNKGVGGGSMSAMTPSRSEVQILSQDIRFIKTGPVNFISTRESFLRNPKWLIASVLPLLFITALLILKDRISKLNSDAADVRSRKATSIARQKLAAAKKHLDKNEHELFYNEVSKALWEFVSGKLRISHADLSKDSVNDALKQKHTAVEIIHQFNEAIDQCEMARFAGGYNSHSAAEMYNRASGVLTALQQTLKS